MAESVELKEQIARVIHEHAAGSDPDELIHHPAQKSWEEPTWPRWCQWEEAAEDILALVSASPLEGGEKGLGPASGSGQAEPGLPAANPAHVLPADGAASPVWERAGNMLYTLTQAGWRHGEPVMVNRMTVTVHWDPRYATDAEGEALAAQLYAYLAPTSQEADHAE